MTWEDIFCWFGWHEGKWGKEESTEYSDPGVKKTCGTVRWQQKECPNCGKIFRRDIAREGRT